MPPSKRFDAAEALNLDSSPELDETSDAIAESSTVEGEETGSLLDAVKDAVQSDSPADDLDGEEPEEDSEPEETEDEPDEGEPEEESENEGESDQKPQTEEELLAQLESDMRAEGKNLQKIARFREVLGENKSLKAELEESSELRRQLDDIAQAADRSGRSAQEVADIFSLPLLFSQDPAKALAKLQEINQSWSQAVGAVVPSDLQEAVDDGRITEEYAQQLAQERSKTARLEQQYEYDRQQSAAERQQTQIQGAKDALNTYQATLVESDPDYTPATQKWHQDRLVALVRQNGVPQDADAAVKLAQQAWDEVKENIQSLKPKAKAKRTITGRRSNNAPASEPKSMLEAVSSAVGGVTEDD